MSHSSGRSLGFRMLQPILLTLSILFCSLTTLAQRPKVLAPHRPVGPILEKRLPWGKETVRQSATGGLWMTDAKWKASLNLTNGLKADSITVTPVLYLSNGQRYPLSPVTLEPSGTAIVDIGQGLESVGIAPYATLCGYAVIEYQWPWAAVSATVKNVDLVNSLIFIFGLQPSPDWHPEHTESIPKVLPSSFEGLWWKLEKDVSGFLALSNVTGQAIHATVRLTDNKDTQLTSYQVTVSPHGTKMLTLEELKATEGNTGGVYLSHDGPERGLDINAGLLDQAAGFSAHLPMRARPQTSSATQPSSPESVNFSELGLMTGAADPMMNFPSGTVFRPYSLLRNISNQPAEVTPELWWMAGGSPQSATLPQMALSPHQTLNLNVPALLATAGLKNFSGSVNLILDTKAQAGGLVFSSGSVDQTNTYVFEVLAHGIAEGAAKELCYWSTGNGDDTMVTLWNPADERQDLSFSLFYTGGQYVYPIQLGPRETRALNVSEILHSSMPDAAGNLIPAGISEGSAEIAGSLGEHQHTLISLDVAVYNVRKATCGVVCWECDGVVSASIYLSPFAVAVGGTTAETFYETWNTGSQHNASASWRSSATSIATVNSSGVVTGVKAGSLTLSANDLYSEIYGVGWYCTDIYYTCPTSYFTAPPAPGGAGSVQITSADIVQDKIVVTLSGASNLSGNLSLKLTGANGNAPTQSINTGAAKGPGTYNFPFQQDTLPAGEFTTIAATWTVNGSNITASFAYHFKVLGVFRQTQYNTPAENQCTGSPTPITVWNSQCQGTDTNVVSGFDFRVTDPNTGTGSGHSINWGDVYQEFACSVGSGDLRGFVTIRGTLGSLSNSTVAACSTNPDLYVAGARVYIRGEGLKTVTDRCPACCLDQTHLDNYTTDTRCSGVASLPNALTVRIY